eukprot:GILK01002579.1.p2 GENE.GILK01002579.1~~GILK01002579.1.p2  ORF type:complete len:341 (+),score=46.25 GILK01002579.1:2008-3030(+)
MWTRSKQLVSRIFDQKPLKSIFKMPRIGTHDGSFHCDEVLACSMLRLLPVFEQAEIVRSRDPAVLDQMDIVVDVGAVFDPARQRFDHHQRGFTEVLGEGFNTKLSSAGLIYKYFGRTLIQHLLGCSEEHTNIVYKKVYRNFIESIDGIDNGISITESKTNYKITTDLSSRVGRMNPAWNESNPDPDSAFRRAMEVTKAELLDQINSVGRIWLPARSIVEESLADRFSVHASGQVMELKQFCPWKDHLYELESEQGIENQLKYVLFQDDKGSWRVQCVSDKNDSFVSRKPLPEPWRGLRDEVLADKSGIPGTIFVHASGFIGGCKTREGAHRMVDMALSWT